MHSAGANSKIDSLLDAMTPEEQIGQMILVYHSPPSFIEKHHIGGVLVMKGSLKKPLKLMKELAEMQNRESIGVFVAIDQEGGRINRLEFREKWKKTPSHKQLSAWSLDSIRRHTAEVGRSLVELGINMNLAPVLDPSEDAGGQPTFLENWERAFGKSNREILPPAFAYIQGFLDAGVFCVTKHFPGYDVEANSDLTVSVSKANTQVISTMMNPFYATGNKAGAVMMSSILYTQYIDKPAVFAPELVSLARKHDSNMVVMTDDLWGASLRSFVVNKPTVHGIPYADADFKKLVEMAFWAGNDILMITFPKKVALIHEAIGSLVSRDQAAAGRLRNSCRRILLLKEKMGLLRRKTLVKN